MVSITAPVAPTLPQALGLDAEIQRLQLLLATELPWLQLSYGKAYRTSKKVAGKTLYYPQVYAGKKEYIDVTPNDNVRAQSFFFPTGPAVNPDREPMPYHLSLTMPVDLVFWVNLAKIDPSQDYRYENELLTDVCQVLSDDGQVLIKRVVTATEEVFKGFSADLLPEVVLRHPYAGFRLQLELFVSNILCKQPVVGTPPVVTPPVVVTPPAGGGSTTGKPAYLTNVPIPYAKEHIFQYNNVSSSSVYPVLKLNDGDKNSEYHPSDAQMLYQPHKVRIHPPEGYEMIVRKIRLYDRYGAWPAYPTKFGVQLRGTTDVQPVASWDGTKFEEYIDYDVPANLQQVSDFLEILAKGINEYPNELLLIGDYRPITSEVLAPFPATPFKEASGASIYYWNGLQDETQPAKSAPFAPKLDLLGSTFSHVRLWDNSEFTNPAAGQLAFQPLYRGWAKDDLLQQLVQRGVSVTLVQLDMPPWMQQAYPAGWTKSDHGDDAIPVRYADLSRTRDPGAYYDMEAESKANAIRYGKNAQADASGTVLWQSPNSWEGTNVIKKGLGLIIGFEKGGENDKDWAEPDNRDPATPTHCSMDGEQLAAMSYANYRAIKAIDPTLEVLHSALAIPHTGLLHQALQWCAQKLPRNPDGSVLIPWTRLNVHVYPNTSGAGQGGGTAVAADTNEFYGWQADQWVYFSRRFCGGMPVDLTEIGADLLSASDLVVPTVPGLTPEQVQGQLVARDALEYKHRGIARIDWYQAFDGGEPGRFGSCGLLQIDVLARDANNKPTQCSYRRRSAARVLVQLRQVMGEALPVRQLSRAPRVRQWQDASYTYIDLVVNTHVGTTASFTLTGLAAGAAAKVYSLDLNNDALPAPASRTVGTDGTLTVAISETPIIVRLPR